jgi:cation diffusion facilitator family transporter
VRGAFLHLAADAAVSAGVVVTALVMRATGWLWLDPAASLLIAVVIVAGSWRLLRDSMNLALDAVPAHIDPVAVEAYLSGLPGVRQVHDLHIWAMSTTEAALTVHLVKPTRRSTIPCSRASTPSCASASGSGTARCSSNWAIAHILRAGRRGQPLVQYGNVW